MIKIGIVGLNEGNGHPYSYSAMFNGFDPQALKKECDFELIKDYLPRDHRNKNLIKGAKVTHIWTQDKNLSKKVSKVSLIQNICSDYKELVNNVDAVIIARDDVSNHMKFIEPVLKKGLPIFIDKQMVSEINDFKRLKKVLSKNYPFLAGSPVKYNRKLNSLIKEIKPQEIKFIQGTSKSNWLRYGHHLLEGIFKIVNSKVISVRIFSNKNTETVLIKFQKNINVILNFSEDIALPIEARFYLKSKNYKNFEFDDYVYSIRSLMKEFLDICISKKPPKKTQDIFNIASLVLAGEVSKKNYGAPISPVNFKKVK